MAPAIWKALRPLQWTKNLFVLMPLVFSHNLLDGAQLIKALSAAALFCLVASSSYLFNDIQDMERDRIHPCKKLRPLVKGDLKVSEAVATLILLLFLGLLGGILLNPKVAVILALYWILNVGYSLKLKHYVILDVGAVTGGFILRIAAGAASISVVMSHWLTLCTALLVLFLVLGKRRYDLVILQSGDDHRFGQTISVRPELVEGRERGCWPFDKLRASGDSGAHGRKDDHRLQSHTGGAHRPRGSYDIRVLDPLIIVFGIVSFGSYVLHTIRQGSQPHLLVWTGIFVLFGICRYTYLLFWKAQGGDPAYTLLTDFQILADVLLWVTTVVWIIYG